MEGERSFRDLYQVLGVRRDAGHDELHAAFREHARRLHPDVSKEPDADERFRELTHAYEVLSKPRARLLYDRLAYRGPGGGGFGPPHPGVGRPTRESAHLSDEELISWIFGERKPDLSAPIPGEDRLLRYLALAALAVAIVFAIALLLT